MADLPPFQPPEGDPYEAPAVDPTAHLAAILDARIDTKIREYDLELTAQWSVIIDRLWESIAELAAGEAGVAYRAFVVSEARRLQVRPGEVAGARSAE